MRALTILPHIGLIMFVPIFGCIVVGNYLDSLLNTAPVFLVIFILIGVGAAFRGLYVFCAKEAKQSEKENKKNKTCNIKKIKGKR